MHARFASVLCSIVLLSSWGCSEQPKRTDTAPTDTAKQTADQDKLGKDKGTASQAPAASTTGTSQTPPTRNEVVNDTQKKIAEIQADSPANRNESTAGGNAANKNLDEYIKAGGPFDTRFIPASAFATYVAYPARILASPAIAKLDLQEMYASMEKEMGFSITDVEQAQMVLSLMPREDNEQAPQQIEFAMEVRLLKPHGGEALVKRAIGAHPSTLPAPPAPHGGEALVKRAIPLPEPQKVEYAGKTYYLPGKDKNGFQAKSPAIYIIDERTFLIGDEPEVKAMLDTKDVKSPLVQLLTKVDPGADFSLVVTTNAQIQKMIGDAKAKSQFPPPLQPVAAATELMAGAIISIKTTPDISLSLTMIGKDDSAAEKLAALIPPVKQLAEQGVSMLRQQAGAASPEAKELFDYGFGKLDKVIAGLAPQRKGNEVVIRIGGLGTLDELATKLLVPGIAQAQKAAKQMQGMNNLKQLALSMWNLESQNQALPAHAIYSKEGKPLLSWRVSVLPYLDEQDLYKQFHLDEPWNSPNNKPLIAKIPKVFMDPNRKDTGDGKTRYVVAVGKGTVFDGDKGIRMSQISDGTSNTILILEVGEDKAVTWTQPDDLQFDPEKPLAGLGRIPEAGFSAAFADGHVQLIHKSIDADTFRRLILRADGEPIDPSKL